MPPFKDSNKLKFFVELETIVNSTRRDWEFDIFKLKKTSSLRLGYNSMFQVLKEGRDFISIIPKCTNGVIFKIKRELINVECILAEYPRALQQWHHLTCVLMDFTSDTKVLTLCKTIFIAKTLKC